MNQMGAPSTRGASVDSLLARPIAADAVLAVLLAVVLGSMSVALLRTAAGPPQSVAVAAGCALVLHASVVWRRRTPRTAYLLAAVAMLGLVLVPPLQDGSAVVYPGVLLPSSMVFGLSLYSVAARVDRRTALGALAVALAGVAVVLVRLWDPTTWGIATGGGGEPVAGGAVGGGEAWVWRLGLAVALAAVVACLWTLGRLSGVRGLYLDQLREAAARAEQDLARAEADRQRAEADRQRAEADRQRERAEATRAERDRIRREMHDVVSHSLAVMVSQAEGGRLQDPQGSGAEAFATIGRVGRESLRDMRALLGVLQDQPGQPTAPAPGLTELPALLEQVTEAGLTVRTEAHGEPRTLRPAADLAAYRVVQEALTNVLKHAGAGASATVALTWAEQQVVLQVEDDGAGAAAPDAGVGLTGMRERTRLVGGSLVVEARPGEGFRVRATIPYDGRSQPSSG